MCSLLEEDPPSIRPEGSFLTTLQKVDLEDPIHIFLLRKKEKEKGKIEIDLGFSWKNPQRKGGGG